jgi:hypothetical protein
LSLLRRDRGTSCGERPYPQRLPPSPLPGRPFEGESAAFSYLPLFRLSPALPPGAWLAPECRGPLKELGSGGAP